MVPQFHEFSRDEIGLIEHILYDFIDVLAPVSSEYLLLFGGVLGVDEVLLEEGELVGVDQDVCVHLLVQLGDHPAEHHPVLLQQALVLPLHPADHDLLHRSHQGHVFALQGQRGGLCEVGLLGLDLLVLLEHPLLLGLAHPAELEQLQPARPKPIVQTDGVDRYVGEAEVLPVVYDGYELVDAALAVPEQVSPGLGVLALLDGDLIGVDLLDLLVVEHEANLQHEVFVH